MYNISNTAAKIDYLTTGAHRNWRKLLQFGNKLSLAEQRCFLWTWPTEKGLKKFKHICTSFGIDNILSIGCGSGLLEWILTESVGELNKNAAAEYIITFGITIHGLEIDRNWWTSGYAVKSFIDLNYIDERELSEIPKNSSEFLQQCADVSDWHFALLFCYFNNHKAFLDYINLYKGDWIIIIGPAPEVGVHTDPSPLEPNFPSKTNWCLHSTLRLCDKDIVVFYKNMLNFKL